MKLASTLCSMAFAIGSGCVEQAWQDQHDFEWRGEYVSIDGLGRDAGQACGDSLEATDDSVRTLLDFHGSNATLQVHYRWLSQSRWDELDLVEGHRAHHSSGEITSLELAHDHELAHAVSWGVHGRTCTPVLEEGLAVVLEDAMPTMPSGGDFPEDGGSLEELLLSAGPVSNADYDRAGHFVAFLLEAHGIAGVQALCEFIPRDHALDLADWDAATQQALGLPLAEVLARHAAYPTCNHHQYRARLTDCGGEPDVIVGPTAETEFSFHFGCDEPDVIGERGGTMMLVKRITVETPGYYKVSVDDGSPIREVVVIHEQCETCSQTPLVGRIEDGDLFAGTHCTWLESPGECGYQPLEGMHAFVFFLDEGLDRDVTVRIAPRVLAEP